MPNRLQKSKSLNSNQTSCQKNDKQLLFPPTPLKKAETCHADWHTCQTLFSNAKPLHLATLGRTANVAV